MVLAYDIAHAVLDWHMADEAGRKQLCSGYSSANQEVATNIPPGSDVEMGDGPDKGETDLDDLPENPPVPLATAQDEEDEQNVELLADTVDEGSSMQDASALETQVAVQEALADLQSSTKTPQAASTDGMETPVNPQIRNLSRPESKFGSEADADGDPDEDMDADGDAEADGDNSAADATLTKEPIIDLEQTEDVAMALDEPQNPAELATADGQESIAASAMKPESENPTLGAGTSASFNPKALRAAIAELDLGETILDIADLLERSLGISSQPRPPEQAFESATLPDLFPDLPLFAPPVPPQPGKPEKRTEEMAQGKIAHVSRLLDIKPVLVSTLQPGKNYRSGTWVDITDTPAGDEFRNYSDVKPDAIPFAARKR